MKTKTKIKTKPNKKVSRKARTKQSKPQRVVMYSKNSKTGYETVMEAEKMEKNGMKSLMVKSESVLPPTVITHTGPGHISTSMLTMAQKRQMVVQSYSK
jgi:fatty acid-binding protein DegV